MSLRSGSNVLVSSALLGFLSSGHGAASKVLSKYIIQCDTPASHMGIPRTARKKELEIQSETGDEDKPEVEPEPENNIELEGLFICKHVFVCSKCTQSGVYMSLFRQDPVLETCMSPRFLSKLLSTITS